jgi:all-trans-retinol 13,14-reductase
VARRFDAIVVGSGLGGLVAGALASKEGRRVLVLEKNKTPGGAAGTYTSGPVTAEASLHEMDGLDDDDPKLATLQALGLTDSLDFVEVGDLYEVRSHLLGEPFTLPSEPEHAIAAVSARFPQHAQAVRNYFERMRAIRSFVSLAFRKQDDPLWWARNVARLPARSWPLVRDLRRSLSDVMGRLFGTDEAVQVALAANLQYFADDPRRMWFPLYALAQGSYHIGGGHYVRGGSSRLVEQLVAQIVAAGGVVEPGRRATRLVLTDGRISGVEHQSSNAEGDPGTLLDDASVVFGNIAPHFLAQLLPGPDRSRFMRPYAGKKLSLSLWTITVGFDRKPSEFGVQGYSTWVFPEWMRTLRDMPLSAGLLAAPPRERTPHFVFADYASIDSGLPGPPYAASIGGLDRVENWAGLSASEDRDRRARWTERMIEELDRQFPGIGSAVAHTELTTASSIKRYLGTPGGAIYGFAPEPPRRYFFRPRTKIPGLYLSSAWTGIGGYTGAILGGTTAARLALRQPKR